MTINELRAMTGLSQSKFASLFGISVRTLQDWECGRRRPPEYVVGMIERILVLEGMIQKSTSTDETQPSEN